MPEIIVGPIQKVRLPRDDGLIEVGRKYMGGVVHSIDYQPCDNSNGGRWVSVTVNTGVVVDVMVVAVMHRPELNTEEHSLENVVHAFAGEMRDKLLSKYRDESFVGWDNSSCILNVCRRLKRAYNRVQLGEVAEAVDLANLVMFLHNFVVNAEVLPSTILNAFKSIKEEKRK